MNYALMKDCKAMYRGPIGAEWHSILNPAERSKLPLMTWPTREGAEQAAQMQGAAVIPANQVNHATA